MVNRLQLEDMRLAQSFEHSMISHTSHGCVWGISTKLLDKKKRWGGAIRAHSQMQAFRDVLDTCGFMDLGFTGLEFTWPGVQHGQVIWERLDRGVAN